MTAFESVFVQASQLPVPERVQLIEALWDTVPEDALPPLSDEWLAEIQRRSAEFDAGCTKTVPWEQVRADAFKRAGINDAS